MTLRRTICDCLCTALLILLAGCQSAGTSLQPHVTLRTNMGDIELELDAALAPNTVLNFVQYVQDGYYDGTVFHRVRAQSLIQGGAYLPSLTRKSEGLRDSIPLEAGKGYSNTEGTIAMVRGIAPNSATSEFMINLVDNSGRFDLDKTEGMAYAAFGKVVRGMKTVRRIGHVETGTHPLYAAGLSAVVPVEPVIIKTAKVNGRFDRTEALALIAEQTKRLEQAHADALNKDERMRDKYMADVERETGKKFVTTESGLRYLVHRTGKGPIPTVHDRVAVQYRGLFVDGKEFENVYTSQYPSVFEVSRTNLGWQEAIQKMHVGARWTIICPPELGFGDNGIPGRIPPDSILVYEIDLLDIR